MISNPQLINYNIDMNHPDNFQILRGIIGFIILTSIRISDFILYYPQYFSREEDHLLSRLSEVGNDLDYYSKQSNSNVARLLRNFYLHHKKLRRSKSLEEFELNIKQFKLYIS